MTLDGLRYTVLDDPDRHRKVLVCYPVPGDGDDPWGVLRPLRGTAWGDEIPVVTGEQISHALHGHVKPLLAVLGRPPHGRAMRIPLEQRVCLERQQGICAAAGPHCCPGSGRMPGCYVAPVGDRTLAACARAVAAAWDEGRHVFVVEGKEFVVR